MIARSRLVAFVFVAALAGAAGPVGAAGRDDPLHAFMVKRLGDACGDDAERLARFEPRMVVVHALVDQTSLPSGWARARVLRPLLGGARPGNVLFLAHRGGGGASRAHLTAGKEYLLSMFRHGNVLVVDRALECQNA
jgi:hypothetical protein